MILILISITALYVGDKTKLVETLELFDVMPSS